MDSKELSEDPNTIVDKNGDGQMDQEHLLATNNKDLADAPPKKQYYSNFDFFCTLLSIVTYLFDLAMDIVVAVYFYHLAVTHGIYHYWYFGLTVLFILIPSLTMTGFSFRWYLNDADNNDSPEVPMWRWTLRLIVLMLQIAPVLRYFDSMRNGVHSRWAQYKAGQSEDRHEKKKWEEKHKRYYELMMEEESDATFLRLFECFLESAPQLVLQLYILIRDPHAIQLNERQIVDNAVIDPIIKIVILGLSVLSSLISLAWSLVAYHRALRYTAEDKNNMGCRGSFVLFLWHLCSISARILAISLFAVIYPRWVGVVCGVHYLFMTIWVLYQRTNSCKTTCEDIMFAITLGGIYVFAFFNAKDERTRYKYLIYYTICFVENTIFMVVWALYAEDKLNWRNEEHLWYYYPGIICHYILFFAGLVFMLTYYVTLHPSGTEYSITTFFKKTHPAKIEGQDRNEIIDLNHATEVFTKMSPKKEKDEVDAATAAATVERERLQREKAETNTKKKRKPFRTFKSIL